MGVIDRDIFEPSNSYGREAEPIYNLTNISPKDHQLGVNLKLHILQPGDKWTGHGPRVKFFKVTWEEDFFAISIHLDPSRIVLVDGDPGGLASKSEVNMLIEKVKRYRVPLLNMWHDAGMSQCEMLKEMKMVDKGKAVRLRKPISFAE